MPTGGEILINVLAIEGTRYVFTVPGESIIAALDAMQSDVRLRPVTCRNEAGAAMMAEATGKLTGRPGVALVARGPGAANAVSGVYLAQQDQTPMLLLVGLPPRSMEGRSAFQDIDIAGLFGKIAKMVVTVPNAARLQSILGRAFRTALSGRPGPVVVGLPEDVLSEVASSAPHQQSAVAPQLISDADLDQIRTALAFAERPVVIVGGSQWSSQASSKLAVFAERFDLPVVASFRRQDYLDNRHRCYAGHAGFAVDASLAAGLKASDLVIALGTDLGDVTTQGFTLLNGSASDQKIIVISADADAAEYADRSGISIAASSVPAIAQLAGLTLPGKRPPWGIWRRDLRAAYEASVKPLQTPGDVKLEDIVATLSHVLADDAILTSGAGNYAAFLHRYFTYKSYPAQLAPLSGSMGYGLPAAIAAKLTFPSRQVVAFAGDGCLQMTSQELMTAIQFGLSIVVIVANNASLGTIRMQQERRYPGRVIATSLMNPDFVLWAQSCGAQASRVESTAAFFPILQRALTAHGPTVIELMIDTDAISPTETIASIRGGAATASVSK